jgi:hypothetical protein
VPRTQASLPEPSGIGFVVLLLLICVLIVVNSVLTSMVFYAFHTSGPQWLKEPRLAQPVLFLTPLLMLCIEIWVGSLISRFWTRPNGDG